MAGLLSGRRIVLTGVSRGVGLASARLLLDEGALLCGVARPSDEWQFAQRELGQRGAERFCSVTVDLCDSAGPREIADAVEQRWGGLDILVNNAGVQLGHESLTAEPDGVLERSLDVNLLAPFRVTRALLPLLERGVEPRVVHTSSGAGTFSGLREAGIGAYRLSKWALNGLAMLQAQEFAPRISVVAFDPGWVRTQLGGPNAPGVPEESARGLLALLQTPHEVTGRFFKDGQEIVW